MAAALGAIVALAGLTGCGDAQPVAARVAASPSASPAVSAAPSAPPARTPLPTPTQPPIPAPAVPPAPHPVVPASWVGPIYPPHGHGYDLSYPQCPGTQPPAGASFSIVGVNGGRGFTTNPCARTEWQAARGIRALYFNSGYDPGNADRATPDCVSRSRYQDGGEQRQLAYAIGAARAAIIWLDVESSNSWDPSNLDLNHVALQAEIDQLAAFGHLVGLYATFAEWRGLMGEWTPAGVVADWVAGQSPLVGCGGLGFSGQPVWLVQELGTWPGAGLDSDWTC
jgi:hypothetical protein